MKLLFAAGLLLLSSAGYSLTCPTVETINKSISYSTGVYPGETLSISWEDFKLPWIYVDNAPNKRKLLTTTKLVQTSLEVSNGVYCIYEAQAAFLENSEKINNTFIRIINADPGKFTGISGTWYTGYQGMVSTCYDDKQCVFDLMDG